MSKSASNTAWFNQNHNHRYTLDDWNTTARVRCDCADYRLPDALEQELQTRHWFVPAFMPYLEHPDVVNAGQAIALRLEANHLVYFLDYTTLLEHTIVNRAVQTLIHDELGIPVTETIKTAALQLYTDEGYHALFSNQIAEQVSQLYGMRNRPGVAHRISRLQVLIDNTRSEHRALIKFMVGFVSETIIAKELLGAARNTVVSTVFNMLKSHLADEARHSRYFSEVFSYVWMHLEDDQRSYSTPKLIEIIGIFFETDTRWLRESLSTVNLDQTTIEQIIAALQAPCAYHLRVRSGASATLSALLRAGIFNDKDTRQLFVAAGFIDA